MRPESLSLHLGHPPGFRRARGAHPSVRAAHLGARLVTVFLLVYGHMGLCWSKENHHGVVDLVQDLDSGRNRHRSFAPILEEKIEDDDDLLRVLAAVGRQIGRAHV